MYAISALDYAGALGTLLGYKKVYGRLKNECARLSFADHSGWVPSLVSPDGFFRDNKEVAL
jgi:hypothetical protein